MAAQQPQRKMSTAGESLYAILEIEKGSPPEDIKKAYRRMALRYHPDKNQNSPEATAKFQEINYANSVLSDETKKSIYDSYGSLGLQVAEQVGEDNVKTYFMLTSKGCKVAMIIACIVTGCCCCCCCCMCFNFCCGKCRPASMDDQEQETPLDDYDYDNIGINMPDSPSRNSQEPAYHENGVFNISGSAVIDGQSITAQPIGLSSADNRSSSAGAAIPMPPPPYSSHQTDSPPKSSGPIPMPYYPPATDRY